MDKYCKKDSSIQEVVHYFGGIPELAHALGIDRHAIYQWNKIPQGRAFQIEVLSKGRFKAKHLIERDSNF